MTLHERRWKKELRRRRIHRIMARNGRDPWSLRHEKEPAKVITPDKIVIEKSGTIEKRKGYVAPKGGKASWKDKLKSKFGKVRSGLRRTPVSKTGE